MFILGKKYIRITRKQDMLTTVDVDVRDDAFCNYKAVARGGFDPLRICS